MPQTRMFRDRVVSMEQTFEGGEKHLELLKTMCREAIPGFDYAGHSLDHERDLFVIELAAPDGRRKRVAWTRMVLFDAERIPVLSGDPAGTLRTRIVEYLKSRATRPEIVVTFRHLEDGWVDTPEPRRDRRRRRRGRGGDRGAAAAAEKGGGRPRGGPPSGPGRERGPRPGRPPAVSSPKAAPVPAAQSGKGEIAPRPDGQRRRFRRRRRRGRGPGGGTPPPAAPA